MVNTSIAQTRARLTNAAAALLCLLWVTVLSACTNNTPQVPASNASGAPTSSTTSQPQQDGAIRAACEDLVLDYAYYRDRQDPAEAAAGVAAVFSEDATLTVLGQTFVGKNAIYNRLAQQTNPQLTQHLMSTIRIFPVSATTATGVSYATVYVATKPAADGNPAEGFATVGEYHDKFELTDSGWRIAQRKFVVRMLGQRGN